MWPLLINLKFEKSYNNELKPRSQKLYDPVYLKMRIAKIGVVNFPFRKLMFQKLIAN